MDVSGELLKKLVFLLTQDPYEKKTLNIPT